MRKVHFKQYFKRVEGNDILDNGGRGRERERLRWRWEKNGASQDTAAQKEWVDIAHNGDVITWKK